MWKKPERTYGVREAGGERGEVDEWVEYSEKWLRDYEYPYWKNEREIKQQDSTWDTFLNDWILENDAIVLCEGDEYVFQEDRYVEFDDGA
jgi:hypothetical protein